MSDEIVRKLLRGRETTNAAQPYAKGLFSSYLRRARDALAEAEVMACRRERRERLEAGKGLRRATEQACKALRVAHAQSATRSRDVRTLVFGDDLVEPLGDADWRDRVAPIVGLSEREVWTDPQLEAWTLALAAIVEELARTVPQARRRSRTFRFASRAPAAPSEED